MPSGGPPHYGRWSVMDVYEARLDGTWASESFVATFSPAPAATPFTTGSYTGFTITASTTMTVASGSKSVEYLVIAGGGGGGTGDGGNFGGGGGAGGYRTSVVGQTSGGNTPAEPTVTVGPGSYTISIGAGGLGVPATGNTPGSNGSPTTFGPETSSYFSPIVSTGGGRGGGAQTSGQAPGGSGGGTGGSGSGAGGTATPGQGFAGGPYVSGGAGGGGGGAGGTATNPNGAIGGVGLPSTITGSSITRAAGGPGITPGPAASGAANSGSGGQGGVDPNRSSSGAGGSGIVIIRWLT